MFAPSQVSKNFSAFSISGHRLRDKKRGAGANDLCDVHPQFMGFLLKHLKPENLIEAGC